MSAMDEGDFSGPVIEVLDHPSLIRGMPDLEACLFFSKVITGLTMRQF
jgi:hypothetical protein